ncbi:hypothetical protein K9M41_00120 [Candidatus Gracilibacteria bacterium]|nr:hypothetical protein [Candidatus Gracilibacteria bacterium]
MKENREVAIAVLKTNDDTKQNKKIERIKPTFETISSQLLGFVQQEEWGEVIHKAKEMAENFPPTEKEKAESVSYSASFNLLRLKGINALQDLPLTEKIGKINEALAHKSYDFIINFADIQLEKGFADID